MSARGDERAAEYAGSTAVLAALLTSVGGLVVSIQALPVPNAQAARLVAAGASRRSAKIPRAVAAAAIARGFSAGCG